MTILRKILLALIIIGAGLSGNSRQLLKLATQAQECGEHRDPKIGPQGCGATCD